MLWKEVECNPVEFFTVVCGENMPIANTTCARSKALRAVSNRCENYVRYNSQLIYSCWSMNITIAIIVSHLSSHGRNQFVICHVFM